MQTPRLRAAMSLYLLLSRAELDLVQVTTILRTSLQPQHTR